MENTTQNYANHARRHAPFSFFLLPVMTINLAWSIYKLAQQPDGGHVVQLLLAAGLVVLMFLTRINPLRVQDRLIRLEEQLRYQRLLTLQLAARASALPVRFIVALRFASDEELPELVTAALDGKFSKADELKRAIKHWRADTLRV